MRRPPYIRHYSELIEADRSHYPGSDELLSIGAPLAKKLGLKRLGIHHERLPPGRRTSWPHAESDEEEFAFVLSGRPDLWLNGELYPLSPGDAVAFPAGTGICHTFINNTHTDVRLLIVGEANKPDNRIHYPLHPERNAALGPRHWSDAPAHRMGTHDAIPDRQRDAKSTEAISLTNLSSAYHVQCERLLYALADWFPDPRQTKALVQRIKLAPGTIAHVNDRVRGFISVEQDFEASAEIVVMAVHPAHQRQGIGRALLETTEDTLRRLEVSLVHVRVLGPSSNDRFHAETRRFFGALGFKALFESKLLSGDGNPTLVMTKALTH